MKVAPCTTSWILLAGMIAAGLFVAVPALSDDGDDDEPAMGKCDSDYKCEFLVISDDILYEFLLEDDDEADRDGICNKEEDYEAKDEGDGVYSFNVCGATHKYCLPEDYQLPYIYGAAIQWLGPKPEKAKQCTVPGTNVTRECTGQCEVLGKGRPLFSFIDDSNPAEGFVLKHFGEPSLSEDKNLCPYNPERGGFEDRNVNYEIHCDKKAQMPVNPDNIKVVEKPTCTYTFVMYSPLGCPMVTDLTPSNPSGSSHHDHSGLATGMFFFGLLLCGLVIFSVWQYKKRGGNFSFSKGTGTRTNAFSKDVAGSATYSTVTA